MSFQRVKSEEIRYLRSVADCLHDPVLGGRSSFTGPLALLVLFLFRQTRSGNAWLVCESVTDCFRDPVLGGPVILYRVHSLCSFFFVPVKLAQAKPGSFAGTKKAQQ